MLSQGHIFTIKTKDPENVSHIQAGDNDVVISGLNVLKDQIEVGDFVFVVFGGDKPKGWTPGLVALAHISKAPFDEGYAGDRNFRVKIDVDLYLSQSIARKDLVTYPATFDTIGIGPITRWEPNQAITAVDRKNAVALLQAICDICPIHIERIKEIVGEVFEEIGKPVPRYALAYSPLGRPAEFVVVNGHGDSDALGGEFEEWMMRVAGKSQKTAKDTARVYVPSISDGLQEPTKSIWHGLREVLYGDPAPKSVYAIENVSELNEYYAGVGKLFAKSYDSTGYDDDRFKKCWDWAHSSENHNSIRAGWALFTRFMQWRDAQQKKNDAPVLEADLLSIALKIFAEKRYEEEWQEKTRKDAYQDVYAMADMTPEQIAAGSLDDFYNDFLLKIWAFQNGGCRNYGQLDETGKTAYRQFVVDLKTQLKSLDAYFPPNKKCPTGMGVGMLTEIMTRFWPKSCCNYNESLIHDAMVTLGLLKGDFVWPKTPSIYQDFMGKCATILRKMEQMKLSRRPNPNNDEPPDYITVNEFLWFVHDYKDLIKEEVMKKQMKEAHADVISAAGKKLALNVDSKEDLLMLRLMSSLRAKPFVILAGHSGTGKSRIVRKLAYMTCNVKELQDKEGSLNFCMIQVKPNWHDSADLLGYRSAIKDNEYIGTKLVKFLFRAYAYPNTPFFLCLDEMNLAPVEQYFAEFLSAMESLKPVDKDDVDGKGEFTSDRVIDLDPDQDSNLYDLGCEWTAAYNWVKAHGFTIPKNLFVVGTVNMDETTCQFSRKVLDRAMTIEMTDASFADYGKVTEPDFDNLLEAGIIEKLIKRPVRIKVLDEDDAKADSTLMAVQRCLEKTPFAVAFRFANEYMLYKRAIKEFDPDGTMKVDSLDHVVLMKVLPRISGEKGYVANIFIGSEDIKNKLESPTPDSLLGIFKEAAQLSHGKMIDILSRKASYLTFWP